MAAKTYSDIRKQIARLEAQAEKLRSTSLKKVYAQIQDLMEANDISIEDLGAALANKARPASSTRAAKPAAGKTRGPVKAKYQSPTDPSLTWTGRGRKPKWVQEWLDAGNAIEGLAIR